MTSFVVKAPPQPEGGETLGFDEKSMWRGKTIQRGDEVFLFAAEHNGGQGLFGRGFVSEAVRGIGSRVALEVTLTGHAVRRLGRAELRPFRDRAGGCAEAEIEHKLYEQATNKIAGISDAAAVFLRSFF